LQIAFVSIAALCHVQTFAARKIKSVIASVCRVRGGTAPRRGAPPGG
jgi:hypothetical protein